MNQAWHIIGAALRDIWNDLVTAALCNLLWTAGMLSLVGGPPATLALFYVANRVTRGEAVDMRNFWNALRRYFGLGWRWGSVNLAMCCVLVGDVILTGQLSQSDTARWIQGGFAALLAGWLMLQLYALPFLFEQETPSLRQAWRNGAVMIGNNISFSLGLVSLMACTLLAGVVLFCLSLAVGGWFVALAANHAVLNRLAAWRARTA